MKLLPNTQIYCFLQQCVWKICVDLQYGIYLIENFHYYVEIEEKEVCVGQDSPEIEIRKSRFFVLNNISVSDVQSKNGSLFLLFAQFFLIWDMVFLW